MSYPKTEKLNNRRRIGEYRSENEGVVSESEVDRPIVIYLKV